MVFGAPPGVTAGVVDLPHAEISSGTPGAPGRLLLSAWERQLRRDGIARLETTLAALVPEEVGAWFGADPGLQEVALLKTCQRIVVLAITDGVEPASRLAGRLAALGPWEGSTDREAVQRIFRIAAGLESAAAGEREVREQVRAAAAHVHSRHPRPLLRRLLLEASAAPSEVGGTGPRSVADLAVAWLGARLPDRSARVVIVGGGTVGRRVAEGLHGAAEVTVVYHQRPPDPAWAARWAVELVPIAELRRSLTGAWALVSAAKSSGRIVVGDELPGTDAGGPRCFVDLGMPRNIDPAVGSRSGVDLVDLEGLPGYGPFDESLRRQEQSVAEAADGCASAFARESVEPWVGALRQKGESLRRAEFEQALAFAGPLPERARIAFERMSERIVGRLLAAPTEELRALPPEPEHDGRRQMLLDRYGDRDDP